MGFFSKHPRLPTGQLIFAVGDIHGCIDEFNRLREKIWDYSLSFDHAAKTIIYLGDYIDRGVDSKGVIDCLIDDPLPDFEHVFIKGNHEQFLLDFVQSPAVGQAWMDYINGGRATIQSYGVAEPKYFTEMEETRKQFIAALPAEHLAFFQNLKLHHTIADYFFVHAGVHPNKPLDRQQEQDYLWIREPFLSSSNNYGKVIVHGHTITANPEFKANRIGIDTGAYWSGVLTAIALHEDRHEFLQTKRP